MKVILLLLVMMSVANAQTVELSVDFRLIGGVGFVEPGADPALATFLDIENGDQFTLTAMLDTSQELNRALFTFELTDVTFTRFATNIGAEDLSFLNTPSIISEPGFVLSGNNETITSPGISRTTAFLLNFAVVGTTNQFGQRNSVGLNIESGGTIDVAGGAIDPQGFVGLDYFQGFIFETLGPGALVSLDVAPVPVPAAIWFMGSGLLMVAGMRKRKS